jgi:hypothetical protein
MPVLLSCLLLDVSAQTVESSTPVIPLFENGGWRLRIWDPVKETWRQSAAAPKDGMPVAGDYPAAVQSGPLVAIFGRGNGGEALGGLYDIRKDRWTVMPNPRMPGRGYAFLALTERHFFVWGGYLSGRLFGDGAILDLSTLRWTAVPEGPLKDRWLGGIVRIGDRVVIWGGTSTSGGDAGCADGAIFDLRRRKWESLPPSPLTGRYGHSMTLWGSRIVVWGGHPPGTVAKDGAILDLRTGRWEMLPEAPIDGRHFHSAVLTNGRLIVAGGADTGFQKRGDGSVLELSSGRWTRLEEDPGEGRDFAPICVSRGRVYVWGGRSRNGQSFSTLLRIDPASRRIHAFPHDTLQWVLSYLYVQ